KNAALSRGVFQSSKGEKELLLRDRATEHPVDLLVGGVAAGLRGLRGSEGLIGRALRATGRRRSRLGGGIRRVSRALGRGEIRVETAHLLLEIVDVGLQRLDVNAAGQH